MACEFILKGKAFINDDVVDASICISSGFIKEIHKGYTFTFASHNELLDLSSETKTIILPGFIDMHVHLRGLSLSYKEDEATGTKAAAAGGITVVADMPNTHPFIRDKKSLTSKLESLKDNSYVDYSIYVGIPNSIDAYTKLTENRNLFLGYKIYPEDLVLRRDMLIDLLKKNPDELFILHSEHPYAIRDSFAKPGRRWLFRDPGLIAMYDIIDMLQENSLHGRRIHITHVQSPSLAMKAKDIGFTIDTAPHYLLADSAIEERRSCIGKINPPLQPHVSRQRMVSLFLNRVFDSVVSDHAPHSSAEKSLPFPICPPGIIGLETLVSLTAKITGVSMKGLEMLVDLLSRNPAHILGVDKYLGYIKEGSRANFTIVEISPNKIYPGILFSKSSNTFFYWIDTPLRIKYTIVGGRIVFADGEIFSKPVSLNIALLKSK